MEENRSGLLRPVREGGNQLAYETKRSPLAGDESPLTEAVHPEKNKSTPVVGFVDENSSYASENLGCSVKGMDDVFVNTKLKSSSKRSPAPTVAQKRSKFHTEDRPRYHFSVTGTDEVFTRSSSSTSSIGQCPALLTSTARKGGRVPSADTVWENDAKSLMHSYFPDQEVTIFVGTWNMAEIKELPPSLDNFLLPLSQDLVSDVYFVGVQEVACDIKDWLVLVQQTLGPSHCLIQHTLFGGLHVSLFIRRDLLWFCSAVDMATFSTKPGNLVRTKGGIGLCWTLFGSSFLFINSHLTAYDDKVAERNSDVSKISANLVLSVSDESDERELFSRFDYIFWCGDLNYRVDLPRKDAIDLIVKKDYMSLLLQDQLTKEILKGNVFCGFSEQPINFQPSYKFDINTNNYDTSEKQRIPSWTDRVMFKSNGDSALVGVAYNICSTMQHSDHKPVYGIFRSTLQASKVLESCPKQVASFDATVYNLGNENRRIIYEKCLALKNQKSKDELSVRRTSSSVCSLL